jgi:hypothetical protein
LFNSRGDFGWGLKSKSADWAGLGYESIEERELAGVVLLIAERDWSRRSRFDFETASRPIERKRAIRYGREALKWLNWFIAGTLMLFKLLLGLVCLF